MSSLGALLVSKPAAKEAILGDESHSLTSRTESTEEIDEFLEWVLFAPTGGGAAAGARGRVEILALESDEGEDSACACLECRLVVEECVDDDVVVVVEPVLFALAVLFLLGERASRGKSGRGPVGGGPEGGTVLLDARDGMLFWPFTCFCRRGGLLSVILLGALETNGDISKSVVSIQDSVVACDGAR